MSKKIAIFPGSFDPLTNGHVDILTRASRLFDEILVAVATNTSKQSLFTGDERVALAEAALKGMPKVRVVRHTGGLTVDMAKEVGATALIRGVRNVKDFEYEESIAMMNRTQFPELESILIFSAPEYRFLSSSLIKEVATFEGDVSALLPSAVNTAVIAKLAEKNNKK